MKHLLAFTLALAFAAPAAADLPPLPETGDLFFVGTPENLLHQWAAMNKQRYAALEIDKEGEHLYDAPFDNATLTRLFDRPWPITGDVTCMDAYYWPGHPASSGPYLGSTDTPIDVDPTSAQSWVSVDVDTYEQLVSVNELPTICFQYAWERACNFEPFGPENTLCWMGGIPTCCGD